MAVIPENKCFLKEMWAFWNLFPNSWREWRNIFFPSDKAKKKKYFKESLLKNCLLLYNSYTFIKRSSAKKQLYIPFALEHLSS